LNARLSALIQITRPVNLGIILLTQLLFIAKAAGWCDWGGSSFLAAISGINTDVLRWHDAGFLMLATLCAAAAGNVVNDIEGQASDAVNKPERRRVGTVIGARTAWIWYFLLLAVSVAASWMVDLTFFLFTAAVNILLFFYSSDLKRMPLAGNILVAFFTAAVVFVSRKGVEDGSVLPFSEFTMMAFLLNLARELVKDVEDMDGDRATGIHTFTVVHGVGKTLRLASLVLFLTVLLLWGLAVLQPPGGGWMFRLHLTLASLYTLHLAVTLLRSRTAGPTPRKLKLLMLFGLLAVIWA